VKTILCDGGYSGKPFADDVKAVLGADATVQVVKRNEFHIFAVIPKRWVVERSFAWLEKQRRLWKNCERKDNTALQFMILTFISFLFRVSYITNLNCSNGKISYILGLFQTMKLKTKLCLA